MHVPGNDYGNTQQAAYGRQFAGARKWGIDLLAGILLREFSVILAAVSVRCARL